ncbi:hypothetical protein ACJMK2_030589 [Sinanodonta woodiana]|uniref:Mitochondria-eating protein n=1 Tax=Sinanodonta woodiana TaxID=1069815 RepID=A0ABD3WW76_SINWO
MSVTQRTGEKDPFNPGTGPDANYSEPEIAKDSDHVMNKFVQALKTIHRFPIEHLEQLLLEHNTTNGTTGLYGQEKDTKWAEARNWQENYKSLKQSHEDLQQKFNMINSELQTVKNQNEIMDKESKFYQTQLQEKERHHQEHEQGRQWQVEYETLEKRYNDIQRSLDQQKRMIADKIEIEKKHEMLKSMFSSKEHELLKEKTEKSQLVQIVQQLDTEIKSYQVQLHEKERQLQEQREALNKANKEKDDAMSRLSRHMGQQMSEGNPNITDLSDPNRPSKLGERYSELYDNEWTNAFEVLTSKSGKDDKQAVDVLRNILWKSYASAFDISRTQIEKAEHELSKSSEPVSPECKRLLKEAQKHVDIRKAGDLIEDALQRTIMKDIDMKYPNETPVHVFAKECFQLCWLMSIQDPPVVLVQDPIKGDRFDTHIYRHYVNSGDTVDYVVWPALLLHKDGPVLTKGVSQPFPTSRSRSAFSPVENNNTNDRSIDKFISSLSVRKVEENLSHAGRMNPNLDDWSVHYDSSDQKKMDNHPKVARTYTAPGSMAATQRGTVHPMQFDINQTLVDGQDVEQFNRFCKYYPSYGEEPSKRRFGNNFDRYYEIYITKLYGSHSSA